MKFSEMNVISIDPSLRSTGVFYKIAGNDGYSEIVRPKKDNLFRILYYFSEITGFDVCLIEMQFMNNAQIEVVGVIKAIMQGADIPFVEVHPDIWRHIMGVKQLLKGVNKKTATGIRLYLDRVKLITCKSFDTTDEADAFLIYRAVCDIMDKPGRLTPAAEKIRLQIEEINDKN